MKFIIFVFSSVFLFYITAGNPQGSSRVHDPELSDVPHHEDEDDHDVNYDHEAFLGKDGAKEFNKLDPKESKERLGKLVDKIDTNKDGKVTPDELKEWISLQSQRYLREDTDKNWQDYQIEDGKLSFENYKKKAYEDDEDKDSVARDQRRWAKADKDGDKMLNKDEFFHFLHPEEFEDMHDVLIDETIDDLDKDKDGYVNMEEYINDMWYPDNKDEPEPDWVKTERAQFTDHRDVNKDGKMDKEEVGKWIMPKEGNHIESETKHLFEEADADKDGFLTKQEILDKHDLFVGSQATDFGEALNRHTEL